MIIIMKVQSNGSVNSWLQHVGLKQKLIVISPGFIPELMG